MAQPVIKTSFASGEWAPKLQGRVDIQKYHAGAALLRNFYIDYSSGGASTRQGSRFINQVFANGARLIPFQPSTILSFVLEFGNHYIRFISNGTYVLDDPLTIASVTKANPGVFSTPNGSAVLPYSNGDWIFLSGIVGMTQLNGAYYIIQNLTSVGSGGTLHQTFTLTDLTGIPIDTTSFGTFTSGSITGVTTLDSPYEMADLFPNSFTGNPGLKYLQDITSLIITHPNYPPSILTEVDFNSWTLTPISFAPTILAPSVTGVATVSNIGTGTSWTYNYTVTAVDANGQESSTSSVVSITNGQIQNLSTPLTNTLTWTAVANAVSYNIYRSAPLSVTGTNLTITGPAFGFISNISPSPTTTTIHFQESSPGFAPDFSTGPPISPNAGAGVTKIAITTNNSALTSNPTITLAAPPAPGVRATATSVAQVVSVVVSNLIVNSNDPSQGGVTVNPTGATQALGNGITVKITSVAQSVGTLWVVTGISYTGSLTQSTIGTLTTTFNMPINGGWVPAGSPTPDYQILTRGAGNNVITFGWNLKSISVSRSGSGYLAVPAVTFSPSQSLVATATIGPQFGGVSIDPLANGNPGVPGFYQTRLMLAGPPQAVQTYYMSQPDLFFNFNVSFPSQDNDALSGTIVGEDLNDIRSLIESPTGIIALTGRGAWLINGGGGLSSVTPITPSDQTANPQAFNGANDLRPIKINRDIIYGTNKGNYFRDLSYNIYANIYTGDDITTLSNHLFFGHYTLDWAWSEEPFKTLYVVRNDGIMLTLGYVKEQELVGWAHHDTDGLYTSVCTVIENVNGNIVDAVYYIVQRTVGSRVFQYVERQADRYFSYGFEDSWNVDCALQTIPAATATSGFLSISGDASAVGNVVIITDATNVTFTAQMALANWIIRADGGIYKITGFSSASVVTAQVVRVSPNINPYTGMANVVTTGYTLWQPITTVSGLTQLIGKTVTGVADGVVVPPQVVSATGTIILSGPATKVTLGLAYLPQLKTLPLDLGEPTVQSKRKKLPALTLRVADTLGLQAGTAFANVVTMKDFQLGNIPTLSNGPSVVSDLYSGDGRTILDQVWQEPGQVCIQQNLPYPATILGVIPEVVVGDTPEGKRG